MSTDPGSSLGPYRIVGQLGRGGMATVYKALQPALERYVAVKVLPAAMLQDAGFLERFQQEAVAVARLRHPHIVAVYDFGQHEGTPYLVMEYVEGGTLADQLGARLPVDYVVRMLGPVASGLDYAHALGIVHRDVKPSNVLLRLDGTPILSDFGIAKLLTSGQRLTGTGGVLGTPAYMAPEQALGEEIGPAADQYALAVVAFEMLTGRVPFSSETPLSVLSAHVTRPVPAPSSVRPDLSGAVDDVLLRALAKQPQDRFRGVSDFVGALAAAEGRLPSGSWAAVPQPPPGAHTPAPPASPPPATPGAAMQAPESSAVAARLPSRVTRRAALAAAAGGAGAAVIAVGIAAMARLLPASGRSPARAPTRAATVAAAATAAEPRPAGLAMAAARALHTATLLRTGKILVAGGRNDQGALASAELFDPVANAWSPAAPMAAPRFRHTATLLPGGYVLVAGGQASDTAFHNAAELYDPEKDAWQPAGKMSASRSQHTATLTSDGLVLVAGGFNEKTYHNSADLYDPAANQWRKAGSMHAPRSQHAAVPLPKGAALVLGGFGGAETGVERYDSTSNAWSEAAPMANGRLGHTATPLKNTRVLVVGGDSSGKPGEYVAKAEVYDVGSNAWSDAGALAAGRLGHTATSLPDGSVAIIGGKDPKQPLATVERYDPASGRWSLAGKLERERWQHTATLLPDGRVLVAGGRDASQALASAERYDPTAFLGTKSLTLQLAAVGGSGVTGTATFSELDGGKVRVTIAVDGAGAGPQPAHIHEGTCAETAATPLRFTLAPVVQGRSVTDVNTTIDKLTASPMKVHMHKSQDELGLIVTCADIRQPS